ncbi:hypothetical protein [Metabacillus iocasae]|uniref:D-glucuronyl C5-epimerase C-terminal domain-containing protein n=1 Tax=Priestia iocasae TaxID=2291674 RepID=A0ABS2QVJ9_9BACI|nr:hypothetical protein [Metabacillus iocasae]MBM7702499.1 hypothetical protein [Metabacillus iocasae]
MKKWVSKKYILGSLMLLLLIGIGIFFVFFKTVTITLNGTLTNNELQLVGDDLQVERLTSEKKEFVKATDVSTTYKLTSTSSSRTFGELTVTVRTLNNDDFFIFTKFHNQTYQPVRLNMVIPFEVTFTEYEMTRFDSEKINHEHDSTLGVDPTTTPHGIVELTGENAYANMVISKNYNSKQLTTSYNEQQRSTLRELIKEHDEAKIKKGDKGLILTFPHLSKRNSLSESWLLYSEKPLFNETKHFDEWEKHTLKEYKKINKWYTAEGPYGKLPWSIEPGTKLGYGRYFSLVHDRRHLDHYEETKERYFYDFIINSVANLLVYDPKLHKPIETEFTSTWLKDNYGIIAPFYDTRFNEYIAIHLQRISQLLEVSEYEEMALFYADYLVDQSKKKNYISTKNGYLISDFYSDNPKQKQTHTSLNHALGEMNFLLESYLLTKNEDYLDVALNIRRGIEDIGDKWIKKNNDLWYQLNPDFTFHGKDYPLLTLEDLLKSQTKFEQVGIAKSNLFEELITSKTTYLVKEEIEITKKVVEALEQEGLEDLVENYPHISNY